MFQEIKARIEEGRWVICGGWWIQPDCNIPSGESFVRQGLIGQNYFKEKFGVTAKVGYNVDSFGHNGMLPQILKKSGMDSYVFMRPGPEEKGLPGRLFLWESKDGTRVKAFRIPFEYCTFDHLENHIMHCKGEFKHSFNNLMCFYGVGNHGGGPTKENIEIIEKIMHLWKIQIFSLVHQMLFSNMWRVLRISFPLFMMICTTMPLAAILFILK